MKYNRTWIAWLMLITGLLITVYAAFYVRSDVDKIEKAEFDFECNEISSKIVTRLKAHAQILRSGAAHFSVSDTVTREQWKAFIEESSINKNLPGIQGTGFSLIVPGDKLQQHIKQIRDEGFPEYTVRPEGKRETYTSIIFLEPFTDRNQRAFGYDMFSEPVRREAMERARDRNVAALSGKVMLVQETETDVQAGNLMYVPVYRKGAVTNTVEQRREAIIGWVYSPYRMNDLMAGILEGWKMQENKIFYLHIFDGVDCTPESMLFESHPPEEQLASENFRFSFQIPVDFNGHQWILQFTQGNKNIFYNYVSAWVALLGGTFISFLLFFLTRSMILTEKRALQIAKKLTSELKEKERLLLESQEVAQLGSYSLDLTTGIWKSSEILDQIFGIDKRYDRSIEGWSMLIHPEYREIMTDYFTNTIIGKKQPFDKEYKILKKDGEERWVHGLGKLEFGKDNNPVRMLGTISDITKRKEADELLQEKEERLRMTVKAGNVGLWSRNLNTNESYFSPEWKNQLGYAERELQNTYETWESLFHPDDLAPTLEKLKASLTTPWPPYEVEFRLRHINGSYRWILSKGSIQFDENGKPTYMLGSHIDITEQKNAENEIKNLSSFNRRILENIGEGIYGVDVDGNCTFINPAGANMLGYTAEELIGVPMHANHHYKKSDGSVYEKEHCPIYSAFTEGKTFRISDEVYWRKNGTSFPVEYTSTPIYENGKISGAVVVYKDITERKQIETKLKQQSNNMVSLLDISQVLSSSMDIKVVFQLIVERACNLFELDSGAIYLIDGEELYLGATAPALPPQFPEVFRQSKLAEHPYIIQCVSSVMPVVLTDMAEADLSPAERIICEKRNLRSVLYLPLLINKQAVAILILGTTGEKIHLFSDDEIKLYRTLASHAALSIENTRLYEQTQRYAGELEQRVIQRTSELQDTKKRLEYLLTSAPVVIYTSKTESPFGVTYMGDNIKQLMGYEPKQLTEDTGFWSNKIYPEDAPQVFAEMHNLFKTGHHTLEYRFLHNNGTYRWVHNEILLLKDTNGKAVEFLGYLIDITQQKQAEEEYRGIIQTAVDGFWIISLSGKIIDVNKSYCEMSGYSRDELLTKSISDIEAVENTEEIEKRIKTIMEEGSARFEGKHRHKDGTLLDVQVSTQFIKARGGVFIAFVQDITERKKAERELENAKQEAEQANRAKSEFLSRMSHELRTPMNSILGFAQLMKMGELKASHKKGVDHIINSGKHLLYLINEVLDISKIEAGHISLSIEPVEICLLMKEIRDIIKPLAAGRQIMVEINPGNNFYVKADLQRLKQVLLNLANNAIKYNHPNGFVNVNCELTGTDGKQNPRVRINISDSGVGISPEDINKLFNPFERIGAEKTETEGTGLGLVVVKKLVDAMNGKVGVESELGKGSTFWVELPLTENPVKSGRQENVKEQAGETIQKGGIVLYIEDNNSNIELVEQILYDHRNLIRLITNKFGENAVQIAMGHKVDLILLDLDLPDIHGSEVLTKLLANPGTKSIPVVIISADAMEKQVEKLLKIGAKGYLTKPLDVIQFLKVIDEYMSKSDDKNYLNNSKNV